MFWNRHKRGAWLQKTDLLRSLRAVINSLKATQKIMKHRSFPPILIIFLMLLDSRGFSQSTNWDGLLTGSQWFVPTQNMLAYITSTSNLTENVQVGDQTLWNITHCVNGIFTGTSSQSLTIPISGMNPPLMASNTAMNGMINTAGEIGRAHV